MRPNGVVSKKCCGAPKIHCNSKLCKVWAADIVPYASIIELTSTAITVFSENETIFLIMYSMGNKKQDYLAQLEEGKKETKLMINVLDNCSAESIS